MGISSFFPWFNKTFSKYITYVHKGSAVRGVDNLLIDMNGIFHPVAQRVFMYGKHAKPLLQPAKAPTNEEFFEEVGKEIDKIAKIVPPAKRLVLCVDGVAPVAKQQQQRQRRYKSGESPADFDPNCLTPGTQIINDLCDYIYKRLAQSLRDSGVELVFSSSAVPGEGEMKLMSFIKYYSGSSDTSAVYGLDADILLLSLCTMAGNQRVLIVRERDMDHAVVDAQSVKRNLVQKLGWARASDANLITDFVFMCFFVGNDFLKRAPGVDIITGSIDVIIDVYKETVRQYGHVTNGSSVNRDAFLAFLAGIGALEESLFQTKVQHLSQYIEDPLFNKHVVDGALDLASYKREYYATKFDVDVQTVCEDYIEGLEWVLGYYVDGVPSWKWYYPYNYSPFISDVARAQYRKTYYGRTTPYDSLYQLLLVLPPRSMNLLPRPLDELHTAFPALFPTSVAVDKGGKRHEYEGEVLIKPIESRALFDAYTALMDDNPDLKQYNENGVSTSVLMDRTEIIQL